MSYGGSIQTLPQLIQRISYHITMLSIYLLALAAIPLAHSFSTRRSYALLETLRHRPFIKTLDDDLLLELCAAIDGTSNTSTPYLVTAEQPLVSFQPSSVPNQHLDHAIIPEIFKSIKVDKDWNWAQALCALDALALCEALGQHTREFLIDLYIGPTWFESSQEGYDYKGPTPPSPFPTRLLKVLSSLKKLEKLTLILPEYHTEVFRTTFQKANASFANVQILVLGPHKDWVIAMCSNVETVSTHDWRWLHSNVDGRYKHQHSTDLIKSAGRATNPRHFEMIEWWTLAQLESVYHAMPGISSLAMTVGSYGDGIESLLPTLSHFRNLTSLVLADAFSLHVGFDPLMCGNVYDGPNGEAYLQQVIEEEKEADEKVAKMVYARIPMLKELWIGDDSKATLSRNMSAEDKQIFWAYHTRVKAGFDS